MSKVKVLRYVKSDKVVVFKVPLHRTPVVHADLGRICLYWGYLRGDDFGLGTSFSVSVSIKSVHF